MKKTNILFAFKYYTAIIVFLLLQTFAIAQQTSSTTEKTVSTHTETNWYMQPWVWVAAVVLIIIILLAAGRSSGKTVRTDTTVKKTTIND